LTTYVINFFGIISGWGVEPVNPYAGPSDPPGKCQAARRRGHFEGEGRGNAVHIVKTFENALWTAYRTVFGPKCTTFQARVQSQHFIPGVIRAFLVFGPRPWRRLHRARGHVPPLLQMAGHRE